mmetsp:Transcript_78192/g.137751  ORF Transcript_78192/g.137751 Transcript_78192/m.137751 type:complete len:229 (+) Transcript_78192:454-1140(+)
MRWDALSHGEEANAFLQSMQRCVDLSSLLLVLTGVMSLVLATLCASTVSKSQRAARLQETNSTNCMASRAFLVSLRGGRSSPALRFLQRSAKILRALRKELRSTFGDVAPGRPFPDAQLLPGGFPQEFKAAPCTNLDNTQRHASMEALEEVLCGKPLNSRHAVRFSTTSLSKHQHGASSTLLAAGHEVMHRHSVDLMILDLVIENSVELEVEMVYHRSSQIRLKEAPV